MSDSDVAELVGYFLSAFGVGYSIGYILRVFFRSSGYVGR